MSRKVSFQFLHIEKTAGMSLHAMLHRDRFLYVSPDPRTEWDPKKKALFLQKFNSGGHSIIRSKDFTFQFTIMRDPIQRYISHFNWRKNIMKQDWSFEQYLQMEEFSNFQFKKMSKYTNEKDIEKILKVFSFIGIFEEFEKTLRILVHELALKPIPVRENQKKYLDAIGINELTEDQLEICHQNNILDFEIYQKSLDLFKTCISKDVILSDYKRLPLFLKQKQKIFNLLTRSKRKLEF